MHTIHRNHAKLLDGDLHGYMWLHGETHSTSGFQARSKDQEILEEGGRAGPSTLPGRDHE